MDVSCIFEIGNDFSREGKREKEQKELHSIMTEVQ